MSDWVELRVHGVSGTPPEDMLASAHVRQVAGDDRSRSFRPTDAQGREVRGSRGQVLEAFHWGRWTSGSWTQALWLLLIPFGIVNAAQFMLPSPPCDPGDRDRGAQAAHAVCGAVLRLLALTLTVLFAIGASVVLADLVAWQLLADRGLPGPPRLYVILGLLASAAVVWLLSVLGRSGEDRSGRFRARSGEQPEGTGLPDFQSAAFFDGDPDNPALRELHRAAGLLVVAWLGFYAARASGSRWPSWTPPAAAGLLGVAVLLVVLLGDPERTTTVTTGGDARPGRLGRLRQRWHGVAPDPSAPPPRTAPATRVARWLRDLALIAVVLAAVAVGTVRVGRSRTLPGMDAAAAAVGIGGGAVLVLLLGAVAWLGFRTRHRQRSLPPVFRRFAGGMAAFLAAAIGFFLGIGFTAGFALAAQGTLNRLVSRRAAGAPRPLLPVVAPPVLQRVSYAWGITALLVLVVGGVVLARLAAGRTTCRRRASSAMTFGARSFPRLPPAWLARLGRAMQLARLKNLLVPGFWLFAVAGVVLAAVAAAAQLRAAVQGVRCGPVGRAADPCWSLLTGVASAPGRPVTLDDLVIALGQVTLLGLAAGLVYLARSAVRAQGVRRGVNVVWDVVAFWPRSAHPFVPPPYAQEVVPALIRRICWHLGAGDPLPPEDVPATGWPVNPHPADTVVLAAHSQGTLISFVALLWLPEPLRDRVRWLTFGSQLRLQFARAFPHYVTVPLLERAARCHGWLSLYRDTDPIAGPVTSWDHDPDGAPELRSRRLPTPDRLLPDTISACTGRRECGREWRLLDPPPSDPALQTGPAARVLGHGEYWAGARDWDDALAVVRGLPPSGC